MNVAFNLLPGPFIFQGVDNRQGDCHAAFDIWPGQTNFHNGLECFPGGGINTFDVWSPQLNSFTTIPDRYYALNGNLSQNAINLGISPPADNWRQSIMRINLVCEGQGGSPSSSDILEVTITAIQEGIDAGMVMMPEIHNLSLIHI